MAKPEEPYFYIEVESYLPEDTSGLHGEVHIRPCPGQGYSTALHVQCSKKLSKDYPVGTKFRIRAKLTDREGEGEFLYSSYKWDYEILSQT